MQQDFTFKNVVFLRKKKKKHFRVAKVIHIKWIKQTLIVQVVS